MVAHAPVPGHHAPGQSEPDLSECGFDDPETLTDQEKRGLNQNGRHRDPSPQEIREACLAIQEEWSPAERRARASGMPYGEAARKHMTRQLNRHGYVRGWTPPVCRSFDIGKGVK